MAEEDEDESQKTEEPTERKLQQSLEKGNLLQSKEVMNFFVIFSLLITVGIFSPFISKMLMIDFRKFIELSYQFEMNTENIALIFKKILVDLFQIVILPITITAIFVIVAYLSQQKQFNFSLEPLQPKLSKISPLAGLKRLFSMKSLVEFVKGIFKIIIVAASTYVAISGELSRIKELQSTSMAGMLSVLLMLAVKVVLAATIVVAILAGLDYFYQRYEYYKNLKMSKKDIKDEFKETEGNPEIKAKLRRLRAERAQQRMMASVPDSDVVITNPTHFAIALKYDPAAMDAPQVVAKGQDFMALQMREIAKKHNIEIYEDPPLARLLYPNAEPGEEISPENYAAVAEVIRYVFDRRKEKA